MLADSIASLIFEAAGISQFDAFSVADLADALLGPDAIEFCHQAAAVVIRENPVTLLIRRDLPDEMLTLAIAMGLAKWWLECNAIHAMRLSAREIASALIIPPLALAEARERLGGNDVAIATEFCCPVTIATERLSGANGGHGSGFRRKAASRAS